MGIIDFVLNDAQLRIKISETASAYQLEFPRKGQSCLIFLENQKRLLILVIFVIAQQFVA